MTDKKENTIIGKGDKVEVGSIAVFLWRKKSSIIKTVIVFIILGFVVALGSQEEFTARVKIIPESGDAQSLSNLSSIVKQFGFQTDAGGANEGIPTVLYPDLAKNLVVMENLLEYEVALPQTGERVTLFEYFRDHQEQTIVGFFRQNVIGFPGIVKGWIVGLFSGDKSVSTNSSDRLVSDQPRNIYKFSKQQWDIIDILQKRITAQLDRNYIVITLTVTMPDPYIAADVADELVSSFKEYVADYRTGKARSDLIFIQERHQEARLRFEVAQQELATYQDRSRGTLRAVDDMELQRLQSQYNLTFNVYNSLAERLEQARIRVQEETPVVSILEPAAVPDRRSEPKRARLLISYTMFGFLVGVVWVYGAKFYQENKDRLRSE